jgi:hypothetical protein
MEGKEMNNLKIQGTATLPSIDFRTNGELKIQGRILTDNAESTFAPLFEWIASLKNQRVLFDIELDYMNTSASMKLFDLLSQLEKNPEIRYIQVNWHYEEDDEDHLETGKLFEQKLERTLFDYVRELVRSEV